MDRTNIRQVFIKGILPNSKSKVFQLDLNMLVSDFKKYILDEFKIQKKHYYLMCGTKCIYDEDITFMNFNKKNLHNQIHNDSHIWVKIRGCR
tara:strand:- start:3900 stop:4175 length:276 start_codon:yes stop_codon:yes gene_type:complete